MHSVTINMIFIRIFDFIVTNVLNWRIQKGECQVQFIARIFFNFSETCCNYLPETSRTHSIKWHKNQKKI